MPTVRRRVDSSSPKRKAIGIAVIAVLVLAVGAGIAYDQQRTSSSADDYVSTYQVPEAVDEGLRSFVLPADPSLLILGDSYTAGYNADPLTDGYAYKVVDQLGIPGEVDGVGGSGFTWGGGDTGQDGNDYISRINRRGEAGGFTPNILLLQGGQNDYRAEPTEVYDKVRATIVRAREVWPGVQVIVMAPSQPQPGGQLLERVASPIGQAARTEQAPFINPIAQRWLTEVNSEQYSGDDNGTHLNEEGHDYLAKRVMTALERYGIVPVAAS